MGRGLRAAMRPVTKLGLVVALLAGSSLLAAAGTVASQGEDLSFSSTCHQLRCQFEAEGQQALEGNVSSIEWTFGPNGTTKTGSPVEHAFQGPGTYDVRLEVTTGETNNTTTANTTGQVTVSSGEVPWSAVAFGVVALAGSIVLARAT